MGNKCRVLESYISSEKNIRRGNSYGAQVLNNKESLPLNKSKNMKLIYDLQKGYSGN